MSISGVWHYLHCSCFLLKVDLYEKSVNIFYLQNISGELGDYDLQLTNPSLVTYSMWHVVYSSYIFYI